MKRKTLIIISIADFIFLLIGLYFMIPTISRTVEDIKIVNRSEFQGICFDIGWGEGEVLDIHEKHLEEGVKVITFPSVNKVVPIFLNTNDHYTLVEQEWGYLKSPFRHKQLENLMRGTITEGGNKFLREQIFLYEKESFKIILTISDMLNNEEEFLQDCSLDILGGKKSYSIIPTQATKEDCLRIIKTITLCD